MSEYELYRSIFAFLCGHFLCLSGSLTQITANNHLASPSTLGFDGLGALGVILAQIFLVSIWPGDLEPKAFIIFGSFIFLGALLINKRPRGQSQSLDINFLILLGLAFNLFVGAVFSVAQFLFMALNYEFPTGLWFGGFRYFQNWWLWPFLGLFIFSQIVVKRNAKGLRLMGLGNGFALGRGVDVKKTQKEALFLSLLLTGLVISFFGVFSFLGLIFPHLLRVFSRYRSNARKELVEGPVLAGIGLFGLDAICLRFTYMGAEFPAGMITSVGGAMLLILLLLRSKSFISKAKNFAKP